MHEMRNFSDDEQLLLPDDYSSPKQASKVTSRPLYAEDRSVKPRAQKRRYWFRSLVLILYPLFVLGYFLIVVYWFIPEGSDSAVKFGRHGGSWVFYSWFLIGVVGFDLSRHGLLGAEAAMLERPFWEVPNLVALLQHSNNTWSSPSGWGRFLVGLLPGQKRDTHRLWMLLASFSIAFFLALPLSGLAMEQSDGYVNSSERPKVIGRTWDDFNSKNSRDSFANAQAAWKIGSPPTLPGFGVLYTPKGVDREEFDNLQKVPNTLPLNESLAEIFLSPQATNPVSGKAWGLRARYSCDIVESVSSLILLNPNTTSKDWQDYDGHENVFSSQLTSKGRGILDYYQWKNNIMAYGQVGFGQRSPVYNGSEVSSFGPEDLDKGDLLEYVLWQYRTKASYEEIEDFGKEVNPTIKGLSGKPIIKAKNGTYVANTSFFSALSSIQKDIIDKPSPHDDLGPFNQSLPSEFLDMAEPIGVRCRMVSTLGYAVIDPWASTFNSFTQMSNPRFNYSMSVNLVPSLGAMAASSLYEGRYFSIFPSINSPLAITQSNSEAYTGFIKPKDLQRSAMLAYATDALQLMYDGKYAFDDGWEHPNLTATEEAKVLTPGEFPILVPILIGLLGYWAVGSILLGVLYGFRRRLNETMDGYAYFRLSTDLADDIKPLLGSLMSSKPHEIDALRKISGSVRRGGGGS
ncbi:hypothetical protein FALBO_502 [Fusarium albosuccineum]|uniref:Uncharacterized protein n=1 Tax=Fusarium albosuccineum TaxID=1237068 RepID=A0A8H4LQI3_9HYPO|nr:hypothetical protein FALBO_502 [Fusarium albosuccineum]